jgi:hypothetical protein
MSMAKSGCLAAFGPRSQSVLGHAGHGIDHGVSKLKEFFFLLACKGIESFLAMIHTQ